MVWPRYSSRCMVDMLQKGSRAAFRLGATYMKMTALFIPGPNETLDQAEFCLMLEEMVASQT